VFAKLNCGGGGGGTGEDGGDGGEASGSVDGGGIRRILCLIRWIGLRTETFASSSSSPRGVKLGG